MATRAITQRATKPGIFFPSRKSSTPPKWSRRRNYCGTLTASKVAVVAAIQRNMPALYAVMGHPISHSRSPDIHQRFAERLGIALEYQCIEVRAGKLSEAVQRFRDSGGCGCNVTVPLKEEAGQLSDRLGSEAEMAGAVNTLTLASDGQIQGDNTDGLGLLRHLRRNLGVNLDNATVLMIGAGGAARGVVPALLGANVAGITITNRTHDRAVELAQRFVSLGAIRVAATGTQELPAFDLVLNASSAGLTGESPALPQSAAKGATCVDMAYGRAAEPFLAWAQQGGARAAHDGWGMLVEQAAESFAIWHGPRPDTRELIRGGVSASG